MIRPNIEQALTIKIAYREACTSAHDFCDSELRRKQDPEYQTLVKDVLAGYEQREAEFKESLTVIIDCLDEACGVLDQLFSPHSELTPDWLEILGRQRKPFCIDLLKFLTERAMPKIDDIYKYVIDCAFPEAVIKQHDDVRKKLRILHGVIEEFVDIQVRHRKRTHCRAYGEQRYIDLMNKLPKI